MKKYYKLLLALIISTAFIFIVSSCGNGSSAVPEYTGMTVEKSTDVKASANTLNSISKNLDITIPDVENKDEYDKEKVKNKVKKSVSVNNEKTTNEYYAMPNDTIQVHVHINNPDECAILLFRLNGKTYQTYEFLEGSNSTQIIVNYKLDSTSGFKELTIDNLKYVDNISNQTRDCKMTGVDTIKVLVQHTNIPRISIDEVNATYTTITAKVVLADSLNLLQANSSKFFVFDGENQIAEYGLSIGSNDINIENLKMGVDYSCYAVGAYDVCDGEGAQAYIFDECSLSTKAGFTFELVGTTKTSAKFEVNQEYSSATFEKIILFDKNNNAIDEITSIDNAEFNNLTSNSSYKAVLYYSYYEDDEKITIARRIAFDTLASEISITKFELINDVVRPEEQINISLEFNNPDNIFINSFILNGEPWEIKGGNQITAAQLYFTLPNKKNEIVKVKFDAIKYVYNEKEYVQEIDGNYTADVHVTDTLELLSSEFISEYKEPGVAKNRGTNILLKFNNPSDYEISKVYLFNPNNSFVSEIYVPVKINSYEYVISPEFVYNTLQITKYCYRVDNKDVHVEEQKDVKLNALVMSSNVIKISTPEELQSISSDYQMNNKNDGRIFQLQNDINMAGRTWRPTKLYGVFDGNGFTIKNLQIADYSAVRKNFGMFTEVVGMITNLTLEDFYFNFEYESGEGGVFIGHTQEGALIKNSYAKNGTLIVKNGSFYQGYYNQSTKNWQNFDMSYIGSGDIDNTWISEVRIYVGNELIVTTPEIDKPNYNLNDSQFVINNNDEFKFKEFDDFVIITSYKGNSSNITLPNMINNKKVIYLDKFLPSSSTIKNVIFEDGIEYAEKLFDGCNTIQSVVLPSTMKVIGRNLFRDCENLKYISIPFGVIKIDEFAFTNCRSITSINLPSTLESIENYAFASCGVEVLEIPDSVIYVGQEGLRLLENCKIIHNHDKLVPTGWNSNYYGNGSILPTVIYNDGIKKTVLVTNAVDEYNKNSNPTVIIGDINDKPEIDFYRDMYIRGWYFDKEMTKIVSFPYIPIDNISILYADIASYVNVRYMLNANSTTTIKLVNGYTPLIISDFEYYSSGKVATEWYLDKELTQKVTFPYIVTESPINTTVFLYPKYEDVEIIHQGNYSYFETQEGKVLVEYVGDDEIIDLSSINNLVSINNNVFNNNDGIRKVIIPEGVVSIGEYCFNNCNLLQEVILPTTLKTIGNNAFCETYNLKEINIPEGITTIESSLLARSSIEKISLPSTLKTIKDHAFENCYNLNHVELPDGLETIGYYAFSNCNIKVLDIPSSVISVEKGALRLSENGYIVVHFSQVETPNGWNKYYYLYGEGDTSYPQVVYDDKTRITIFLIINSNYNYTTKIRYIGSIDSQPVITTYSGQITGWYLDENYINKVTFPYAPDTNGIYYLYAKIG